jgi:hypothetical protein
VQQETLDDVLGWLADWREAWQASVDHAYEEVDKGQALLDAARNELAERVSRRDHARNMLRMIDNATWLFAQHVELGDERT